MIILHPAQRKIIESNARFKIIRAGRKAGKTILEVEDMAFSATEDKDREIYYIAPTQVQARDIIWGMFRRRLAKIGKFNEQRLEIITPTQKGGSSLIKLAGWENRENFRGKSAHKLVFDEVDTMRDFFFCWLDIFRPTLLPTRGPASFIGTPKKENPNLRRLEKEAANDKNYRCFYFTSKDNPYLSREELLELENEYKDNRQGYRQEILAEYVDQTGSLFHYDALIDVFSNTITKKGERYLTIDVADDGSDKTIFSFWEDLEEYRREEYERLNTEMIINKTREYASQDKIPYSHIAVDAIGVGAGVASSSMLDGIVGYKSSYSAIKTDISPVRLPNVHYLLNAPLVSDYKNLRSQCVFILADLVNKHLIASRVSGRQKENIIEELSTYQDMSKGDGKRMATQKEEVRDLIGRSPDASDCWLQRIFFEIKNKMLPRQSEENFEIENRQREQFLINRQNFKFHSTK